MNDDAIFTLCDFFEERKSSGDVIYQYNFGPVMLAFRYTKGIRFAMHQHLSRHSKRFRRVSYRNCMVACTDRSHSLVAVGFNSRQCIVERAAGFETACLL